MKTLSTLLLAIAGICLSQHTVAQCNGIKGPNILGAKGSFSAPYIAANTAAATCIGSGTNAFSPVGNAGNALTGCNGSGIILPCSDYTYTAASGGLGPESRYAILKTVGNSAGGNCIKGDWRGSDHTGDGGYFMAVNGAANASANKTFYQIKSIPVCPGTTYEISCWVINVLSSTSVYNTPAARPDIIIKVNEDTVARSGMLENQAVPAWVRFGGTFTANSDTISLQFVNRTAIAGGNDFGIDDISLNICGSNISAEGPANACSGNPVNLLFTVTDPANLNSWNKMQFSNDGGLSYSDLTAPAQGSFNDNRYTVTHDLGNVNTLMTGIRYRLVAAASPEALASADCGNYNDYLLTVADCGPLPVTLTTFNGRFANGTAWLEWQTSREMNTARFEIQKSHDGRSFSTIGQVRSSGYSSTTQNYTFQDNNAGNGKYAYYRLKQVDADGRFTISNIIRLGLGESSGIDIYPNPFSTQFTIALQATFAENARMMIRNNTGQVVHTRTLKLNRGNNTISIDQLPPLGNGTYFIQVAGERINYQAKMQKQ